MDVMTGTTGERYSRRMTRDQLAELPDDGLRYELIDGELLVNAAPSIRHQRVVVLLWQLLSDAASADLWVMVAPTAVGLAVDTEIQPDVLVAPRDAFTEHDLPGPPLLAVEVLSPSTRRTDLVAKRARLERAGCPAYWVIDPDEPRLTAWELDAEGTFQQVADVAGSETWTARHPFPVTVVPTTLLD